MKLQHPFIQLPLLFDAAALAAEIEALGEAVWMPHPQGFPGNSMLPLVASEGDPRDESYAGRMKPTPHLEACPYLGKTIAALGAVVGRTRLMRLSGHAEVTRHADQGYYWADRVRVHVPVATQPTVRFECDDTHTNMAAGECWIFDTWRQHRVLNDDTRSRIHLVVDTLGSEPFWALVNAGRTHRGEPVSVPWQPRHVAPGDTVPAPLFETGALPVVMTPWELGDRLRFLLSEARPDPGLDRARSLTDDFLRRWRYLWAQHGEQAAGWPAFRTAAQAYVAELTRIVGPAQLRNELGLVGAVSSIVLRIAVSGDAAKPFYRALATAPSAANDPAPAAARSPASAPAPATAAPRPAAAAVATSWGMPGLGLGGSLNWGMPVTSAARAAPANPAPARRSAAMPAADGSDPVFERPVFIVSSPRAGSTMLFEALAKAPGIHTIGGESHRLIEDVPGLDPASHGFDSNRLEAVHARPEVMQTLRQRFLDALHDRDKQRPGAGRVRMLEKTPKNSLRVPFLARVFPEAMFVYLYRDPRETIASMMEAWRSGRFRTYPQLPGWDGPWSLLLVPGWRELRGKPLADVVAFQWETATRLLLDDLQALPAGRHVTVRYDAVVADPQGEMQRLARATGLGWDREVQGGFPLSRYTLTAPRADKWREHEADILPRLGRIEATMARAARFAGA